MLISLTTAVLLTAAACASGNEARTATPAGDDTGSGDTAGGEPAPLDFTSTQLDGESFDGKGLLGSDTVLWFWAPWCTSCRAEAPDVVEAAGEFAGSVEVIGVPGRGGTADMQDFVSETGTGSLRHVIDSDGAIWRDFGIIGQPAFAFIDDDGTLEVFVGGLGKEQLAERMDQLATS
jgi:thiol-disulfide isomerase/thioredoxin